MPRTGPEIQAEANRLIQEIQPVLDSAQGRLGAAQDALTIVPARLVTARAAAQAANAAVGAADLVEAEDQCSAARINLAAATGLVAGDPATEWKECRATIDRFDKLLVDLRKTGFGLVTTLVSVLAVLAHVTGNDVTPQMKLAVFGILGLLIIALFGVDRTHQAWLAAAVNRATELEVLLNYKLTRRIEETFHGEDALVLGVALYLILMIATTAIFAASFAPGAGYRELATFGGIVGVLFIVAVAVPTRR